MEQLAETHTLTLWLLEINTRKSQRWESSYSVRTDGRMDKFFYLYFNQQSECKVFYKLMCWLAGSLTCRLPNVVRPPPVMRSRKFSHCWLMFGSSFTRFLYHTQRRTTVGRTPLDEWSARRRDLYLTTHNTHNRHPCPWWDSNPRSQQASGRRPTP